MDLLFLGAICFLQGILVGMAIFIAVSRTRYKPSVALTKETDSVQLLADKVKRYCKTTKFTVIETPNEEFKQVKDVLSDVKHLYTASEFLELLPVPTTVFLLLDTQTSIVANLTLHCQYSHVVQNALWVDSTRGLAPKGTLPRFEDTCTLAQLKEALIAQHSK